MATFFFSYAHLNISLSAYLNQFISDLSTLLRERTGRYEEDLVFLDRKMEPGADWPRELREALRTCQVFFSLESPAYFQSDYCGKEWSVFRRRLEEHAAQKLPHPLHIRVSWLPLRESQLQGLPKAISNIQDTRGILGEHAKDGFEYLLRRNLESEYQAALTKLVELAIEASEKYPLPPAKEIPDFSAMESAFHIPEREGMQPVEVPGLGHVRFAVIAGAKEEVRGFRKDLDGYGTEPLDWRPFHPAAPQRIGAFAQGVAAGQNLTSTYLQTNGDLSRQLQDAEQARNVVVFLVDPWALEIGRHRECLQLYDDNHKLNASLMIPWPVDQQTRDTRPKLLDRIQVTLAKTAQREPDAYRKEIDSFERLASELIQAITAVTARLIEQMEVTRRLDSSGPPTFPLLSGPSGAPDAQ